MSCSDLNKEKMGSDKICGSKCRAQMFDMDWMKNGYKGATLVSIVDVLDISMPHVGHCSRMCI
jgi:hypothetical protein